MLAGAGIIGADLMVSVFARVKHALAIVSPVRFTDQILAACVICSVWVLGHLIDPFDTNPVAGITSFRWDGTQN